MEREKTEKASLELFANYVARLSDIGPDVFTPGTLETALEILKLSLESTAKHDYSLPNLLKKL